MSRQLDEGSALHCFGHFASDVMWASSLNVQSNPVITLISPRIRKDRGVEALHDFPTVPELAAVGARICPGSLIARAVPGPLRAGFTPGPCEPETFNSALSRFLLGIWEKGRFGPQPENGCGAQFPALVILLGAYSTYLSLWGIKWSLLGEEAYSFLQQELWLQLSVICMGKGRDIN